MGMRQATSVQVLSAALGADHSLNRPAVAQNPISLYGTDNGKNQLGPRPETRDINLDVILRQKGTRLYE